MKDFWNYLKEQTKPIVLYGMGNGADKVIEALKSYGIKVSGVFASDSFVRKKTYKGFTITNYKTAKERFGDMIVLVCFGTSLPDVLENIRRVKGECETYVPDVPVCGGPIFTGEFYSANLDKINRVRQLLSDDFSRKCFDNIIKFKLSGDMDYLFSCETKTDEPYLSFPEILEAETFVDLGAYRGDTVFDYLRRVGRNIKIIAAEPDAKTFLKLKSATKDLQNITLINGAVCDKNKPVRFSAASSRASTVLGAESGKSVPGFTLDSLNIKGDKIYIKADIEGAEMPFIKGAEQTIKTLHPKMRIAAYHKSADIFEIPLAIHNIYPNYRIYLRHSPCLPAWDTDYFFI